MGFLFFSSFGQVCNRFEIALNRIIIQQKGLGEIREIPPELAFSKGVDYFTEIVFFYMAMFGIAIYEMDKAYKSGKKTTERLDNATNGHAQLKTQIDIARTDVNRIKTLQQNNRKEIELLEGQIVKLEKELEQKLLRLEEKNAAISSVGGVKHENQLNNYQELSEDPKV